MTTTWYLYLLIAAGLVGVAILLRRPLLDRLMGLAPTQPADPDETDDRPDSGADEEYQPELERMRYQEGLIESLANEVNADLRPEDRLNILDDADHEYGVEMLLRHQNINEEIDEFKRRIDAWCDDLAGEGWQDEPPVVEPHSFPAVRALVEGVDKVPTGEYRQVVKV